MVLAMVLCANAGDLMLNRGMSAIGAVRPYKPSVSRRLFRLTVASGTILIAIFFLTVLHASYMTVLTGRTTAT